MANTTGAQKAFRSDKNKRAYNDRLRRAMKEAIKSVRKAIDAGDISAAEEKLPVAYKAIDKAAKRFLHKNTAARYKSRITKAVVKAKNS
ncbi:MAG: 30S ribosomal protein S20 [Candidatus Paceibacterota bacterium]